MPMMPPKPCSYHACKEYAVKDGRCEKHKREAWESNAGKTAAQRGYGAKWQKLRKQILIRDGYLCQQCLRGGIVRQGNNVDHITPKSRGGTDAHTNLQVLCKSCHDTKTLAER